ncbi:MAG: DUF2946 family protein [Thauera phenolivorans]|uniref:DUF2946 family protein n=1 Tax=Thauera phenolivorans TaxID=1792543 RepID=A0A7X7LVC1_9RHOO|nr:DUF2946 family protein [Thauera phenolivorans]
MSDALPPWPQVPACYGWLSLDARGRWRLRDETITHPGLIAFLNAHYDRDDDACWLVNNGPQRVYVRLDSAPWVLRLQPDGRFVTQTGRIATIDGPLYLDAEGRVFVRTDAGPASLDDRDLAMLIAELRDAANRPADDASLAALLDGQGADLHWHGRALVFLGNETAAARLGFVADPCPPEPAPEA